MKHDWIIVHKGTTSHRLASVVIPNSFFINTIIITDNTKVVLLLLSVFSQYCLATTYCKSPRKEQSSSIYFPMFLKTYLEIYRILGIANNQADCFICLYSIISYNNV